MKNFKLKKNNPSINDIIASNQNPKKWNGTKIDADWKTSDTSDEEYILNYIQVEKERRNEYNNNIKNLDPDYLKFKPVLGKILVRVYATEIDDSKGFVTDYDKSVKVSTKSGVGHKEITNNYKVISPKAIVVKGDEYLPQYTIIQLNDLALNVLQNPNTGDTKLQYSFMDADSNLIYSPYDVTNKHFGYLLISMSLVDAIIEE